MAKVGDALRAPYWPVVFELLALVGAVAAFLYSTSRPGITVPAIGYVLGALLTVVLASTYRGMRATRRSKNFRENPALDNVVTGTLIGGLIAGIACAFLLATELAK